MMGVKMECKKLYERCKKTPICTKIDITLANTSHYFFSKDNSKNSTFQHSWQCWKNCWQTIQINYLNIK